MTRPSIALAGAVLALSYPVLAHSSIALRSVGLAVAAIGVIVAVVLLPALAEGRLGAWFVAALTAAACWLLAQAPIPELPLYAPPVMVPGFMTWVFGRTLLRGRTPLIAQLIEQLHTQAEQPPPADVWGYARRLTFLWTVLFAAIASVNFLLALIAVPDGLLDAGGVAPPVSVPQTWWSLFANVIGYLLVAAFFLIEYAWRRRRFPQQPYRDVFDFFRRLAVAMPHLIRRRD